MKDFDLDFENEFTINDPKDQNNHLTQNLLKKIKKIKRNLNT